MATLETRLAKLEAPHIKSGPLLILIGVERTPEQEQQIAAARAASRPVVFLNAVDADL